MGTYRVTISAYQYYVVDVNADSDTDAECKVQEMLESCAEASLDEAKLYDKGAYVVEGETFEV